VFALVSFVLASVLGTLWAWIVWIVLGGIAGAIADQVVQGNKLGILGNIIVGIVGGLLGGFILGLFGVDVNGIFWTFVAVVGAIVLLLIVHVVTGGAASAACLAEAGSLSIRSVTIRPSTCSVSSVRQKVSRRSRSPSGRTPSAVSPASLDPLFAGWPLPFSIPRLLRAAVTKLSSCCLSCRSGQPACLAHVPRKMAEQRRHSTAHLHPLEALGVERLCFRNALGRRRVAERRRATPQARRRAGGPRSDACIRR
jgi:uncharacterized membrane protein YeaQ/YmgE (transglycosylase-associated protein family)